MQVSFCSKYKFISTGEFTHRFDCDTEAVKVDSCETAETTAKSGKNIYTVGAGPCTVYGIGINKNSTRSALGHYAGTPGKIVNVLPELEKGRRKGFIIGGRRSSPDEYFKETEAKYRENKVQTTIFWGQDACHCSDVCYVPKEDAVYISTTSNCDDKYVDGVEYLKRAFQIIKIANGDEVYIGDSKINPLDIIT